jgi:hypothetical protein
VVIEGLSQKKCNFLHVNILLQVFWSGIIRPAFTTTVYAFLSPKFPSATWAFFCLKFDLPPFVLPFPGAGCR